MRPLQFSIFLSASIPNKNREIKFLRMPNAQLNIEEAIISLCRCIFQNKGKIIFGGHPSISPLVGLVATEFSHLLADYDKPILIFQSHLFDKLTRPGSIEHLHQLNTVQLKFTEVIDNEIYHPEIVDKPQCPKSLGHMRDQLLNQKPDAMICIGGMEGVIQEYKKFREHQYTKNKPVYILPFTGGAAEVLSNQKYVIQDKLTRIVNAQELTAIINGENKSLGIFPYPIIMQQIIHEVINQNIR